MQAGQLHRLGSNRIKALDLFMVTYALDFETYYDKECSIKTLGPLGYFSHPNFDAYMVSVVGDDGYK